MITTTTVTLLWHVTINSGAGRHQIQHLYVDGVYRFSQSCITIRPRRYVESYRMQPTVTVKLIHTATPDTTKLSGLCRVRFGGVNWLPDNLGLPPTENSKSEHVQSNRPIHTGTPDTTQTGPSCRVWCDGVNWVGLTARQVRSASECVGRRRHCRCDRRTHSDTERTCVAVGATQFTPPDTTQTARSCRVWRHLQRHLSVRPSVCPSVGYDRESCKMTEPIDKPFGARSSWGSRNHTLTAVLDSPPDGAPFLFASSVAACGSQYCSNLILSLSLCRRLNFSLRLLTAGRCRRVNGVVP